MKGNKKFLLNSIFLLLVIIIGIFIRNDLEIIKLSKENVLNLAIYLNNSKIESLPTKDSGYILDETKSFCDNGAVLIWDYQNWSPKIRNLTAQTNCTLYFKNEYKEALLAGTEPVLTEELVPITIEADGTVTKADLGSTWYSYADKQWANAVILIDEEMNYNAGEVIPESAIESYFVWIPKYRYQLWNLGLYTTVSSSDSSQIHSIPILFGDYNTSDSVNGECSTPMSSGASGNCGVGDYMTHPAFLSIASTGFWAGKFETGYNGATKREDAEHDYMDTSKILIKPDTYTWRKLNISNIHQNSFNYKRNLDSHMMKNTEWGAIAYLSHSNYGNTTRIRINNNQSMVTGFYAVNEPTCGYTMTNESCNVYEETAPGQNGVYTKNYWNEASGIASTNGNKSGVYDMSGGTQEWAFAVMQSQDGSYNYTGGTQEYNSGFNGMVRDGTIYNQGINYPENKYYDKILYKDSQADASRRILGDATGELGPFGIKTFVGESGATLSRRVSSWYDASSYMVALSGMFIARGHYFAGGTYANIFSNDQEWFDNTISVYLGYRIVLTPSL